MNFSSTFLKESQLGLFQKIYNQKNIWSTVFKLSLLYNGWYVHVSYGLHMMQKLGRISTGIREVWVLYRWFCFALPDKKSWNLYFWCCFKGCYRVIILERHKIWIWTLVRQNLKGSILWLQRQIFLRFYDWILL